MLLRNSAWNFIGSALPALVALATLPLLLSGLGLEGFGIVTLITSIVGYCGVLDINLSAGSIKYLAEYHATGDQRRFSQTFWLGLGFYFGLGLLGGMLLSLCGELAFSRLFTVSAGLHAETALALQIAALGFALSQLQNYLLVVPQALQRFDRSAAGEAFFGIVVNLASAAAALNGGGIAGVMMVRVGVSLANLLWLVLLMWQLKIPLRPALPGGDVCLALLRFSGYSYLSRLASMLHQHADKLIVGALAGPIALAIYTVPTQLAGRILGLTYRLTSVIYPRVAVMAATGQQAPLAAMYLDVTRLMTYVNLAVLGIIALAGESFLARWVGSGFIATGYPVLLIVTLALLADSLTSIPSLVNDGLGHPQVSGRFALMRGLLGVALVYIGTLLGGIIGAALSHLLASLLMGTLFLIYVHKRILPVSLIKTWQLAWRPSLCTGAAVLLLLLPLKWLLPSGWLGLLLLVALAASVLLLAGLLFIIKLDERAALLLATRRFLPSLR